MYDVGPESGHGKRSIRATAGDVPGHIWHYARASIMVCRRAPGAILLLLQALND